MGAWRTIMQHAARRHAAGWGAPQSWLSTDAFQKTRPADLPHEDAGGGARLQAARPQRRGAADGLRLHPHVRAREGPWVVSFRGRAYCSGCEQRICPLLRGGGRVGVVTNQLVAPQLSRSRADAAPRHAAPRRAAAARTQMHEETQKQTRRRGRRPPASNFTKMWWVERPISHLLDFPAYVKYWGDQGITILEVSFSCLAVCIAHPLPPFFAARGPARGAC